MACNSSRFDAIIEKRIPFVLSVGALDMVNFGVKDTMPSSFRERKIYEHNKQVKGFFFFFFFFFFLIFIFFFVCLLVCHVVILAYF